jgi:membrane protein
MADGDGMAGVHHEVRAPGAGMRAAGLLGASWRVVKQLFWAQFRDRIGGLAAEISFFAMLSVFPALLVLAAALGSLEDLVGNDLATRAESLVLGFLDRILTDEANGAIEAIRGLFEQRRASLLTVASLFAVYGVTRAFAAVINGLDVTHGTREKRSPIRFWSTALALALGSLAATILLLGVVVIDPLFGGVHGLAERIGVGSQAATVWSWLRWPTAFLLLMAWATALYHFAPYPRTRWRHDVTGAALAAVLWLVVSFGFSTYLRIAAAANPVLSVLGGGVILLIWAYLLAIGLLMGGEVNALLAGRGREPDDQRG